MTKVFYVNLYDVNLYDGNLYVKVVIIGRYISGFITKFRVWRWWYRDGDGNIS
jgi:hypothetical protein